MTTRRRILPKVRDSISFLYFEHCRIEQDVKAIAIFQEGLVLATDKKWSLRLKDL